MVPGGSNRILHILDCTGIYQRAHVVGGIQGITDPDSLIGFYQSILDRVIHTIVDDQATG